MSRTVRQWNARRPRRTVAVNCVVCPIRKCLRPQPTPCQSLLSFRPQLPPAFRCPLLIPFLLPHPGQYVHGPWVLYVNRGGNWLRSGRPYRSLCCWALRRYIIIKLRSKSTLAWSVPQWWTNFWAHWFRQHWWSVSQQYYGFSYPPR